MKLKFQKRLFAGILAAGTLTLGAFASFAKTNTYTDGQFKDVKTDAWYAKEVASAYELGFMNGTSTDVFSPEGNVTVAQGITMAVRVHANFNGKEAPANSTSGNWYDSFVKYALDNGIIKADDFDSYTRNITRAEMATLFADAVPASEFAAKNDVKFIPDVNIAADYAEKILMLYKAGVVMGSDAYGTFNPDADIKRSEAAAIINRVAIPENRLEKSLKEYTARDAYQVVYSDGTYSNPIVTGKSGMHENLPSGWVNDNRGGAPKFSIEDNISSLVDVSTTEGTALIREVNKTQDEKIVAEFSARANGNGAYVEFRDEKGSSVYKLYVKDGKWSLLCKDGKYTALAEASAENDDVFRVYIDQKSGKAKTFINNKSFGEHDLLSDNILNFRFATDEEGTASISAGKVNMVANYGIFEIFDLFGIEEVYGWKNNTNASVKDGELVLSGKASISKSFDAIDTKYIAEALMIFPEGEDAGIKVMSGNTNAIELKSIGGKLHANGKAVYDLTKNMWYRLRVEANPSTGKAEIIVNGRTMGYATLNTTNPVDTFTAFSESGNVKLDNIKVYANVDHCDYVPEPEAKADFSDYILGLNVCSLWRNNGTHYGWASITPFDERKPVLGYYDEGNPETADWEIKFMAEHGIDVQAFCWYSDVSKGPLKEPRYSYQLHDGYQQAKYEDYMKYCLIWECGSKIKFDMEQFKNHVIPYWFENYFLDENYFVLDNKLVLDLFAPSSLSGKEYFGSTEGAKKALEYLDGVAKSYGFDGMMYLSNGDVKILEGLGIDAGSAYHWDVDGHKVDYNKQMNISKAESSDIVYQIPTISMGYNDLAWVNDSGRKPLMSVEDYDKAFEWVKEEYIPKYADKGTSQEKLVWISTWNEYGEGTYVSPTGLNEFGYLDVLRKHFTNLDETHEDEKPTEAQAERINRLFPQYARLLRNLHTEIIDNTFEYEVVKRYEFTEKNTTVQGADNVKFTEDGVTATSTQEDFHVYNSSFVSGVSIDDVDAVRIYMSVPAGYTSELFFETYESKGMSQKKATGAKSAVSEMTEYVYDFSENELWKGNLTNLRLDPANGVGVAFTVKAVELLRNKAEAEAQRLENERIRLYINGLETCNTVYPEKNGNDVLFAFDPETNVQNIMHTFATWNHDAKTLTLEANGHKAVFAVGSDKYTLDGAQKDLGYKLYTVDGLPMLSFKAVSDAFGFTYSYNASEKRVDVTTDEKTMYDAITGRVTGQWEFNSYDLEGWQTSSGSITANGGYITFDNTASGNKDPSIIIKDTGLGFNAKQYNKAEIRVRYKYQTEGKQSFTIYFLTDTDKGYDEKKARWVGQNSAKQSDDWEVYTVDFSNLLTWTGKITAIRFDPFNTIGSMDIDYIRFIPDPDYVEVDTENITDIINGDAELKGAIAATSPSATITIVEDSQKAGNHVYNMQGQNKKAWTYFEHEYPLESGETYKFSYDIRAVKDSAGKNNDIQLRTNIRYFEVDSTVKDHVCHYYNAPADGSWVHVETMFTVKEMASDLMKNVSVYAEPTSEASSACFQMDNIKVEKLAQGTELKNTAEIIEGTAMKEVEEEKPAASDKTENKTENSTSNAVGITNGNAETEGVNNFTSPNAKITRVADSAKAGNHVWRVEAPDEQAWAYIIHDYPLAEGTTYKMSVKIRAVSDSKGNKVNQKLHFNVQYNDETAQFGKNHPFATFNIPADGSWVLCEKEVTVKNKTGDSIQTFAVYADPTDDSSSAIFEVDDFTVVAVN